MTFKQIFRSFLCLLVVCCLIVNLSPLRAQAVTAGALVSVAAASVVAAVLIGLGIMPGVVKDDFNNLVQQVLDKLSEAGKVASDATMLMLKLFSGTKYKLYAPEEIVSSVRDFVVDFGTIVLKTSVPTDVSYNISCPVGTIFSYSSGDVTVLSDCYAFCWSFSIVSKCVVLASTNEYPTYSYSGTKSDRTSTYYYNGWFFTIVNRFDSWLEDYNSYYAYSSNNYDSVQELCRFFADGKLNISPSVSVGVDEKYVAGSVALPSDSISVGYSGWADTAVTEEDEDGNSVVYYPTGIAGTYTGTISQTQEKVQTGESTYVDSATDSVADSVWYESIVAGINSLIRTLSDVWTWLQTLPQVIVDAISSALTAVFVPAEGFLQAKVDALTDKFPFVQSIIDTGTSLESFIYGLGSKPPIIYIDLGAATSWYAMGGKVVFLDLTWYAQYKPDVDVLLSAFLWIWFVWRMILSLPGILNGTSGMWGDPNSYIEINELRLGSGKELMKKDDH